jgi:hypothetical protein
VPGCARIRRSKSFSEQNSLRINCFGGQGSSGIRDYDLQENGDNLGSSPRANTFHIFLCLTGNETSVMDPFLIFNPNYRGNNPVSKWVSDGGDLNASQSLLGVALVKRFRRDEIHVLLSANAQLTDYEWKHIAPYVLWDDDIANILLRNPRLEIRENTLSLAIALDSVWKGGVPIGVQLVNTVVARGANVNHKSEGVSTLGELLINFYSSQHLREWVHGMTSVLTDHGARVIIPADNPFKDQSHGTRSKLLLEAIAEDDEFIFDVLMTECTEEEILETVDMWDRQYASYKGRPRLYVRLAGMLQQEMIDPNDLYERCHLNNTICYVRRPNNDGTVGEFDDVDCDSSAYQKAKLENRYAKRLDPVSLEPLSEGRDEVVQAPSGYCYDRQVLNQWWNGKSVRTEPQTNLTVPDRWRHAWRFM